MLAFGNLPIGADAISAFVDGKAFRQIVAHFPSDVGGDGDVANIVGGLKA